MEKKPNTIFSIFKENYWLKIEILNQRNKMSDADEEGIDESKKDTGRWN